MAPIEFESGRAAILGTGREGQSAWRYLRRIYPDMQITLVAEAAPDHGFSDQLAENDHLLIGPLSEAGLENFDVLVRSPGISPYRNSIRQAVAAGAQITSPSNLWFADHPAANTICITGTKGKSTTSSLLAHMLEACGFRVRLAGNIGLPLLDCDDREIDWWVIELSSYQLCDLEADPSISVILNLSSEHLDWHGGVQKYRDDKLRLAQLAGGRPVIANAWDPLLCDALSARGNAEWFNTATGFRVENGRLFEGDRELSAEIPDGLPGSHNLSNLAAALTVLRSTHADVASGIRSIASFRSLPHRLQYIGERARVRFVNDSISSAPVATMAALEAFSEYRVTLLVGGLDRGLDWTPYMAEVKSRLPDAIIGIPDNGARIIRDMRQARVSPRNGLHESHDLAGAVELALNLTRAGGIVLLSPGAPSFPQFRDFRDRGQQFTKLCGFESGDRDPFPADKNKAAGPG